MRLSALLFIFAFTFWTSQVWAAPYRRLVNFEWEAIEGAKLYDVELKQVKEGEKEKVFSFKVKDAIWNGRLSPGKYLMKLRSRDYRGVPGEWSEPSEFNVGLENVILKTPANGSKISAKEADETNVRFSWDIVEGANEYVFELTSEDGKTTINKKVEEPHLEIQIPVSMNYTWSVFAENKDGFKSDDVSKANFTIFGPALNSPKIEPPENEFVREVKWSPPEADTTFDIALSRFNEAKQKWDVVKSIQNYSDLTLPVDSSLPGGQYQFAIRAKKNLRPSSPTASQKFKVREGDRSPAAEYSALVRKSIERLEGWYGIASYLITEMQFSGANPEKNSSVSYNAVGGTGRLGVGWFSPNKPWGFLGIIDLSGFTFNGKTHNFASAEANAIYRKNIGDRGELRLQMGPYYKELPETVGDPFAGTALDLKITSVGPHLGAEYWFSLTPKIGVQLNTHVYISMLKISTPNGQDLSPTLSTQFGFLGSYRFSSNFTGLVGYARREEKMSYRSVPNSNNFAVEGDVNESTIVGNYLNFFAEWAF